MTSAWPVAPSTRCTTHWPEKVWWSPTGRHGTVVLDGSKVTTTATDLAAAADTLVVIAHQLGIDATAAHQALDEALRRL